MLLLVHVVLTLWVSWAHGQGRTCDFPEIKHGNIYEENTYKPTFPVARGKYFYYSCDHSFVSPSGSLWTQINCTEGGWSPAPRCIRQCFFPWVENGHSTSSGQTHQEGDSVQIVCDQGHRLANNQDVIVCTERGWSTRPTCSRINSAEECGRPPAIDNGDITSYPSAVYAPGSSVEYQCQAFYVLAGNRRITCRNGEWSEPPKCLDACVISPEVLEEHKIEFQWSYAKKLYSETNDYTEFRCRRGYYPKSPRSAFRVQCREGKMDFPTCW
ncbi:complement factor H-related protein 2 [Pipistrellus kuhlii]|uniref:Complement factor H related 2 n=1 Tax=Pipistrellus kuhlii TaxID=59472 RepID=A0A7J7RJQ7_PIPKU|nr:complement factor H-related protein 2 [Pipistrellus kuhlii]KAF6276391.1 complement factor H related 2 [Pipistrellus kuhlii]